MAALFTAVILGGVVTPTVVAQERVAQLFVDGEITHRFERPQADSVRVVAEGLVDSLRGRGYYFAQIDTIDTQAGTARISRGPMSEVGAIEVEGISVEREEAIREMIALRPGDPFSVVDLESDVERILAYYAENGRFLASVEVSGLELMSASPPRFGVTLEIEEGPPIRLKRIDLIGANRTSPAFVARVADLQVGEVLSDFDPHRLQQTLDEAGFFQEVGDPDVVVEPDSSAVLRIPIREREPGSFDLVLGYLPPQLEGESGSVVGNGHLELRNLFGGGRALAVQLHRLPGQASSVDVRVSNPFIFGLPVGIAGRFYGLEQDSTYGKQEYSTQVRYHVAGGVDLFGSFSREVTSPGQAGLRLGSSGRQIIPSAEAWFLGLGAGVRRLDRRTNPTKGMFVEMNLESGRKERSERIVLDSDTTRRRTLLEQKRLRATARIFIPTFRSQVLVFGGDAGLLISDDYDRSDLFRFGGAATLRGYDEDRFLGRSVGRALIEYRLLIDRISYGYAFFDLGYVERPATPDLDPESAFHPGYGIGIQFRTAVGLVNVSAALNPESGPTEARIHAGLSFGL